MFASYDLKNFPIVIVSLEGSISNDFEFDCFLKQWEELYRLENKFTLIFDLVNMDIPHPKYCFKMAMFIKKLRQMPANDQLLAFSIIFINSNILRYLLDLTFSIQPPVAPVYLTNDPIADLVSNIQSNNFEKINVIEEFKPGQPLLYFL